ncbi:MAG TPA: glucose 1-dehydrogenase [Steroidobacteraceae bacterium]|nr:glucose 1-dehydrogenase [Steroidobacteraceae bacterium]
MSSDNPRLRGKVAIVTGGARGLGAAYARGLVEAGARVTATDVLEEEGRALAGELGENAMFLRHDVTRLAAWTEVVRATEERFGPVGVLVNNAGIIHQEPLETVSEANYRRVIDVNQVGVLLGMQAVLGSMLRAGKGSIINISSVAGLTCFPGIIGYVASKWAVRGMSKAAAVELGPRGIRVNSVHPGFIDTPMNPIPADSPAILSQPLPRKAMPQELAGLIVFLASDESSYCTGSEFIADGGYTAQ